MGSTENPGKVSVIISAHNEGANLVDTVRYVLRNTTYPDFEVVVVDDGSTDGSVDGIAELPNGDAQVSVVPAKGLGVAGARNLGARHATGKILVFLDAHCYGPPGWLTTLVRPLMKQHIGMVGPSYANLLDGNEAGGFGITWHDARLEMNWLPQKGAEPYPVPLDPGGCQAVRKADFEKIGCYDPGMTRWGSEGEELSLRFWLMGFEVVVHPQVVIYHLFRESHPYQVDMDKIIYNRLRMATLHLNTSRLARVLDCYKGTPGFSQIMTWLLESDVTDRRAQLFAQRRHDDDWFCAQFNCQI